MLHKHKQKVRDTTVFCTQCGQAASKGDTTCPHCGAPLEQDRKPARRNRVPIIVGLLALAITIGAGGFGLWYISTRPSIKEVHYGEDALIAVAPATRFLLYDQDGNPLSQGEVELWPIDIEEDVTWSVATLGVDEEGVCVLDSTEYLPEGTYDVQAFSPEDKSTAYQVPDVYIDPEEQESFEVHVTFDDAHQDTATYVVPSYEARYEVIPVEVSGTTMGLTYGFNGDWSYAQIDRTPESDVVTQLNATLKQNMETRIAEAKSWNPFSYTPQCLCEVQSVPYLDDHNEIAALVSFQNIETWNGTEFVPDRRFEGAVFNLKTGETIDLNTLFDLTNEEIRSLGRDALTTFLSSQGVTVDESIIASLADDDTRYFAGVYGLNMMVRPAEVGLSGPDPYALLVTPYRTSGYEARYTPYIGRDVSVPIEESESSDAEAVEQQG